MSLYSKYHSREVHLAPLTYVDLEWLGRVLTETPASICKIKQSPVMPRINSSYISDLLIGLNYLRMKQIEISQLDLFSLKEFSVPIVFYDLIKVESTYKD